MDIDSEIKDLAEYCFKLIAHDGIHSFRPLACVPSTKKLMFMMDRRGLVDGDEVRAWGLRAVSNGADFLVAYHSGNDQLSIDAFVGTSVTSVSFEAPDAYV